MARLIDGKEIAAKTLEQVARDAAALTAAAGSPPGLAVVLVGNDPASEIYVGRKIAECRKAGIQSFEHRLPDSTSQADLLQLVDKLNIDPTVHGMLVQLPLPSAIDAGLVLDRIDPSKDVDGFHPVNVGRLSTGTGGLVPCTPLGCTILLDQVIEDFRGLEACVIGRSNIVGKPISMLLLARGCTVTMTHSGTRNLPDVTRRADIVVAAVGRPELVRGDWIKPGAIVIDVGINRVKQADGKSRLVGDCATHELDHAYAVTPVPGGVGPMTIACLLANTVQAATKILNA